MYIPSMYRVEDLARIRDLIRASPLATLVTVGDGVPVASHVPVILDPEDTGKGALRLCGHMNRMNPQWELVASGCFALLIFVGPHGYVSPTVYGFTPAAPTWNFTAVHAGGPVRPIAAGEPTMRVIRATVEALEGRFGGGWDMRPSFGYFHDLVPGVGAFSVTVERLDAMRKLSQEQSPCTRERVAEAFAGRANHNLAQLMRQCLADEAAKGVA